MATKPKPKPRRGPGPGQPPKPPGERIRSITTALSPAQIATARRIGGGSPQDGIRRLIDRAAG